MKVKALRGVCVGVNQHLIAGDVADLDAAMVTFLEGIGAVQRYSEPMHAENLAKAETPSDVKGKKYVA